MSKTVDLKWRVPVTEVVAVDVATSVRIERGIKDADEGRTVPLELEEVRKLIRQWMSKFESQKPR